MNEGNIVIPRSEYAELVRDRQKLIWLMDALYMDASLNFNGSELTFAYDHASITVLKLIDSEAYETVLQDAKDAKARKEANDVLHE